MKKKKVIKRVWKKHKVKPNRILYTKGNFKAGKGYPDWISIDKNKDTYGKDPKKIIYEVGARKKINPKTISGHFKHYKTKSSAMKFARVYRKKINTS